MADNEQDAGAETEDKSSEPSVVVLLAVVVVLTLVAAGGGAVLGMMVPVAEIEPVAEQPAAEQTAEETQEYSSGEIVMMLRPIVTNLVAPRGTYIRLEGAAVLEGPAEKDDEVLINRVTQDIMSVLHTMTLAQIEGASGLQHLREDLTARAMTRSDGKVKEIILHSMVVE